MTHVTENLTLHCIPKQSIKNIYIDIYIYLHTKYDNIQGPVVWMPVSANPGLNFNLGLFFFSSKALSRIIFYILFRVPNHQIIGKEN